MNSTSLNAMMREAALLSRMGRLVEAAAVYARLLSRWPESADAWYNLALIQRRLGRFDDALASYAKALEHRITKPEEVHLNRAVIFADDLRREAEAEGELVKALTINPEYVPAHLNLANLREDQGDRTGALALYERAVCLDPTCYTALARVAGLQRVEDRHDPLIVQIQQAIADPRASVADKAKLGFAVGRLLDQCGNYDEAFSAYVQANRHSRAAAAPGLGRYDRRAQERTVDDIIAAFPAPPVLRPFDNRRPPPIFICGMFRSGSTLIEQSLASHPEVTAGGELDILPAMVRTELAPFPLSVRHLAPARFAELTARYQQRLAGLLPAAKRVTDKRPDNFLYIGLIKTLFPTAKIVHTKRHPLDNCLSVYFLHLDHSMPYALDLADTAHYMREHDRLLAHWRSIYGADILDVDYDGFVRAPRPALEALLKFLDLEWNDACLAFHTAKTSVRTASVWQVREPLYTRASGRWRHYSRHLEEIDRYLGLNEIGRDA